MATLESSLLASEIVRILGVSSLQEAVTNTLAAREHWNLPDRFVVFDDHQDGGVILPDTCTDLQTGQNKVYNSAWEFVPDGIETDLVCPSLLEYVRDVMDRQRGFRRLDSVGDRADAVKVAG
jgi:hypothetical protein